jgi:hypothetical protein
MTETSLEFSFWKPERSATERKDSGVTSSVL